MRDADVDHFIPRAIHPHAIVPNIDGVWNLVLACRDCNRGQGGKSSRLPDFRFLGPLHKRNEFLISSHPLRETLILQTGDAEPKRRDYLQTAWNKALGRLMQTWGPAAEGAPML